jgi:uncharacterized protein (DUF4415 family)
MKKSKLTRPTAAEDRAINAGIAADPDTHELSDAEFKKLKPFRPGRPKVAEPKEHVSLRLDQKVMKHYRAMGRGWQSRVNADLLAVISKAAAKPKR